MTTPKTPMEEKIEKQMLKILKRKITKKYVNSLRCNICNKYPSEYCINDVLDLMYQGYNLKKKEAEEKQKEFIEKLKEGIKNDRTDCNLSNGKIAYAIHQEGKEVIYNILDKLSKEVFGGKE